MIRRIEIQNYRGIRRLVVEVPDFAVLVGPNAVGKSTVFDALLFIRDFVELGYHEAISGDKARPLPRCREFRELTNTGYTEEYGGSFSLSVDLAPPASLRWEELRCCDRLRYSLMIQGGGIEQRGHDSLSAFSSNSPADTSKRILNSDSLMMGNEQFVNLPLFRTAEHHGQFRMRTAARSSSLRIVTGDEGLDELTGWLRRSLENIHSIALNPAAQRVPAASDSSDLDEQGQRLPVVVAILHEQFPDRFESWLRDLQSVFPMIDTIDVIRQEYDGRRFVRAHMKDGAIVNQWSLSDGLLRAMTLMLFPYLPSSERVYLIEEPENGIHPRAIETVFSALQSTTENQVLVATHSPVVLSQSKLTDLLCFTRAEDGTTTVVRGNEHPALRDWRGEISAETLLASGVLS
ncbi:MAG: AAA family ATPase [Phycisphaerales bacterium]|nr:AAA family ATPase [Phycisphaerales bacterium]